MRELFSNKSSVAKSPPIKGVLPEWNQLENKKEVHLQQGKITSYMNKKLQIQWKDGIKVDIW